ncbi:hypothetical protein Poly51_48630 [Rubripirellula tenax]|uniref:Uncharacterized protein n=1 Tax=Rubripirellula tenax TaxID=2528015 RepID=A0A5C6ENM4_9BACT|nr:hypothetical protein Poly51_48630 [Rubripirellula tenax]
MRCNGAGLASFHEWKINSPGPLIAPVNGLTRQMFDVFGCTCDYCDGRLQFCC